MKRLKRRARLVPTKTLNTKPVVTFLFWGKEIRTQVWFDRLNHNEPKLTIQIGDWYTNQTYYLGNGRWVPLESNKTYFLKKFLGVFEIYP